VDVAGNVYIADTDHQAIKEWTLATSNVMILASTAQDYAAGVAVDGSGNVYIACTAELGNNDVINEWTAANSNVATLVSMGLLHPGGVAVDGTGNVYIADSWNDEVKEVTHAFVDPTPRLEKGNAGSDSLPVVLPATQNLFPPFAPTSDQPWLTITGITNGVVSFAFTATTSNRAGNITVLGQTIPVVQGGPVCSLGTTALLEGPAAGIDGIVLAMIPVTGAWTATANATWLHLSVANQSGNGSTNLVFSYDANPGATRSGTLTIGDQSLAVTQAGSTYVAVGQVAALASGLPGPVAVAVDGVGNAYIADLGNSIQEWTVANGNVTTLTEPAHPIGVAVDGAGNVYIAGPEQNEIELWTAANTNLTTLVTGLNKPYGVAVDNTGNVFIADTGNNAIKKWTAANSNLTTVVSSGLNSPEALAVDAAGNVYIADTGDNAIKEWTAVNNAVTTLVSSVFYTPIGVAVDGSGNVYFADDAYNGINQWTNSIYQWTMANGNVTTVASSSLVSYDFLGVAVDGARNVYIADDLTGVIEELPHAFVDPTPKLEGLAAGTDVLPVVLPATENLLAPFAPTSDQSWLTITGVTNGVVSFSFTTNAGPARTANITLLGQTVAITQGTIGTPPMLNGAQMLGNGVLQFAFSNTPNGSFTVLCTTNLSLPWSNWTVVGAPSNMASGLFQFTSQPTTNDPQLFYGVRSP
jgi:sugar lactone lactonase YvrE